MGFNSAGGPIFASHGDRSARVSGSRRDAGHGSDTGKHGGIARRFRAIVSRRVRHLRVAALGMTSLAGKVGGGPTDARMKDENAKRDARGIPSLSRPHDGRIGICQRMTGTLRRSLRGAGQPRRRSKTCVEFAVACATACPTPSRRRDGAGQPTAGRRHREAPRDAVARRLGQPCRKRN